jgi:hypothetical protein
MSLEEVKQKIDLNTEIYISVTNGTKHYALNFCKMITDYPVGIENDWETFSAEITDKLVIGYGVTLPGYIPGTDNLSKPVRFIDVLNTLKTYDIDYADNNSGISGVYAFRFHLPDLKISLQSGAISNSSLSRCIPVVNGIACRPIMRENVLYAVGGANLCVNQRVRHATHEVNFIDFTKVGDIEISSIRTGLNASRTVSKAIFNHDETILRIEVARDLTQCTPVVSLLGMLLFNDQFTVVSSHTIKIDLNKLPLNKCAALINHLSNGISHDSDIASKSPDFISYLKDEFNKIISSSCFVALVNTKRFIIKRDKLTKWSECYIIDNYNDSNGILIADKTGTVKNYHYSKFTNKTEFNVQAYNKLFILDHGFMENQILVTENDCLHHDFEDLNKTTYTLLRVSGE